MTRLSISLAVLPALVFTSSAFAAAHTRHATLKSRQVTSRSASAHRTQHTEHAAGIHHDPIPAMEPTRATAIQAALIHAGYLTGEPTGIWDADSAAAMQKLQDDNGWQTKFVPDSRALVKLGLGPGTTPTVLPVAQPTLTADAGQPIPAAQP